ncbi:MerR family transcriptional regulator [Ornithinimicrobium sp. F0845]|uniref:MerR family transcriptional regulator n=1 Tax=Ornithinimicrobium sp. F0845 TaxID=2926412 RepID=UPI001FF5809F|nr:MerR family transcriptional regulator [Ornithinimicrobium sp. F0845]MCK0111879.1 MerR family transcriptional regulator [Ornithinimicrobium sp. F0845]
MRIAEVSTRSGVPPSTLRYYESVGLLQPTRGANGYRVFEEMDLERLGFIAAAKRLGLELPEIRRLLTLATTGTCGGVKEALLPLLAEQVQQVEQQIASLISLRDHLAAAQDRVVTCPDSPQACRSECVFRAMLQDAPVTHAPTGG